MQVKPGSRLGSYEITAELGAGGMGRVYRARDTRLGREVAIKIVHPHLARDPEHIRRFRQEAESLAAVAHPNVATVYQFEETDAFFYLVMELVPGDTLLDRLTHGPFTLRETLVIASQVAAAIEVAHEKSIIHRDLKPANIKITSDGVVKVLDFGLAKMLRGESSGASVMSTAARLTQEGTILGTVAYMSPEQTRGRAVDRRTDIWAFGCVMFEMLSSRQAFAGDTAMDTMANVLEREPRWALLPEETPASIRRLIGRCLEKDLSRRLRDIGDARLDIDEALSEESAPATRPAGARGEARTLVRTIAALGMAGGIGALAAMGLMRTRAAPAGLAVQFVVPLPASAQLANLDFPAVAVSPDGSLIAYVASAGGRPQLFIRPLQSLDARALPQTEDAISPFFSPDGRWLGFFSGGQLKKVPVAGGIPTVVCDAQVGFGATWGSNDVIVFAAATGTGLSRVPAAGGTATPATTLNVDDGEFSHRWPDLLPDGDTVLFTVGKIGSWDDAQIVAQSLSSGRRTVLIDGGTSPRYVRTGHLVYARGGDLMAVPFDRATLDVRGAPVRVIERVLQSVDGAAQVSVSAAGHLVYAAGRFGAADRQLISVDRSGAVIPLAAPVQPYAAPRVSPDGQQLIVAVMGSVDSLWRYEIAQGRLTQFAFEGSNAFPVWAPNGRRLAFSSTRAGVLNLFVQTLDTNVPPERVTPSESAQVPGSWSPDEQMLVYVERHPNTGRDIWILPTSGDRTPYSFLTTDFDESSPRASPNGSIIAYVSNESGRNEVYLRPLRGPLPVQRVSGAGGTEPVWAPSGRELFYRNGDELMSVAIDPATSRVGAATTVFRGSFVPGTVDYSNYDVTPDGLRFVMVREIDRGQPGELRAILNWLSSLAATVTARPS